MENKKFKKKIILHDQQYTIGGPKAVLDGIVDSYLGKKYEFVSLKQPEGCGFNPIKAIKFILKYRKKINAMHADVIYICGLEYVGLLMTIAAKLSNIKKVVLSVHGSHWDTPECTIRKLLLMYIIEPLEIKLADSVITVCESAQRIIKPLHNQKNNDGIVYNTFPYIEYDSVPSGTLRKELGIPKNKIIVTSVGRVVERKGHAYTIEAIKCLEDDLFVFIVVGDGDYLDVYRNKCKEEISKGKVFLLGRRTDVYSILKDSDIFLFATLNENHSIALLEAVNMKCCALCTNIGGNPEIIRDGVTGVLIPHKNSRSMVEGLKKIADSKIRKIYADAAYIECKEKFSIENTYGKLDKIFEK